MSSYEANRADQASPPALSRFLVFTQGISSVVAAVAVLLPLDPFDDVDRVGVWLGEVAAADDLRRAVDGAVHGGDRAKVVVADAAAEVGRLRDHARRLLVDRDDVAVPEVEDVAAVRELLRPADRDDVVPDRAHVRRELDLGLVLAVRDAAVDDLADVLVHHAVHACASPRRDASTGRTGGRGTGRGTGEEPGEGRARNRARDGRGEAPDLRTA